MLIQLTNYHSIKVTLVSVASESWPATSNFTFAGIEFF